MTKLKKMILLIIKEKTGELCLSQNEKKTHIDTDHLLGAEVEDDEGDPDDAGGVHSEADELGFVEVLR